MLSNVLVGSWIGRRTCWHRPGYRANGADRNDTPIASRRPDQSAAVLDESFHAQDGQTNQPPAIAWVLPCAKKITGPITISRLELRVGLSEWDGPPGKSSGRKYQPTVPLCKLRAP